MSGTEIQNRIITTKLFTKFDITQLQIQPLLLILTLKNKI